MKLLHLPHRPIAVFGLALTILLNMSACGGGSNSNVTYSIGGTVSGLSTGMSLILQNNGGDDLTVTANGGFTFPTTLGGGNTYDITVFTQPSDQTCTVVNGTGILFGLNVTDISVTCTLNGHSVGGSVSGLQSGHSIVLQNNGGDNFTVSSNGDFTFTTTLQSGASYDVSILTPPSGQSCTLNNGSGTIAAADVDDVTVVCRTWQAAALIENNDSGAATNPQIAVDTNGNAIAVWQQDDGLRTNIWANRYTPSGGWVTATLIENNNSGAAQSPRIAMNAGGDAVAVWQQSDGARFNVLANRYTTAGWEGATLIESDNTSDATHPAVAITDDGNATAVWQQSDSLRTNIWANRYTAAAGWGSATLIESDNNGDAQLPQIAATSNSDAAVVWQQSDGSRFNIWANRYSAAGWGSASLIESDNSSDALYPQVAAATNGDTLAVWQQSDGALTNIWANTYR